MSAPGRAPDPIRIDVSRLVQKSVASLHAHLVTRPTGRAVRLAIETQLAEVGDPAVSLVDLADVSILDYSCADEVVAKLLLRYLPADRPRNAYFVFRGVQARHREPMEAVLHRQQLAAVAQREDGAFDLVGARTPAEDRAWQLLEAEGRLPATTLEQADAGDAGDASHRSTSGGVHGGLARLLERRLVFRDVRGGHLYALSHLVREVTR
jgi:hypothetical protein